MKKIYIAALVGLFLFSTPVAVSAAYQKYEDYFLYSLCSNNYTNAYAKATDTQNIVNKVTAFKDTNKANFWATDANKNRISRVAAQTVGHSSQLVFTKTMKKGTAVRLGMENFNQVGTNAKVSGEVDFK